MGSVRFTGLLGAVLDGAWPQGGAPQLKHTGHRVPECYAAVLESCSGPLTREHYISSAILEQMDELQLTGVRWQQAGETRRYKPKALVARILCEAHNNALSSLDAEASEFYRAVTDLIDAKPTRTPSERRWFDGTLLERWALKAFLGTLVSKIALQEEQLPDGWTPPMRWLQLLFGLETFQAPWGLYSVVSGPQPKEIARAVEHATIGRIDTKEPIGADMSIGGLRFRLVLADDEHWDPPPSGWRLRHRPSRFRIAHARGTDTLNLFWSDHTYEGGTITVNVGR